jgi:3-oxoadipate enol-lactonase
MGWFGKAVTAALVFRGAGPLIRPLFRAPQEHPWQTPGRTVFVGDREFMVRQSGPEDGEPILLVHGLAGSSIGEWYRVAPLLSENYRVTMVDHRGHGLSVGSMEAYEIDEAADDVAGVLDDIGIASINVVGYSLGGTIAQAFAKRYPGRTRKLILIATFARQPVWSRRLLSFGALAVRGFERIFGFGTADVRAGYLLLTGAVEQQHGRWFWDETHRRDIESGAQATLSVLRFDSSRWLNLIEVESLVVIPTRDQLVPVAMQYDLASLLRSVKVVEVEGARHELPWARPQLLADEIEGFLRSS